MVALRFHTVKAMSNCEEVKVLLIGHGIPDALEEAHRALTELEVSAVLAASHAEAIGHAKGGGFALVVLDVSLVDGDALETARLFRASAASLDTPILFLIPAQWGDARTSEALALGAVDVMPKPLLPGLLRARLALYLNLHSTRLALDLARQKSTSDLAFLAGVLDSVEDAIVACDSEGKLTIFNRASRELHGLTEEGIPREQWSAHYSLYRPDGVTALPVDEIPLVRALAGEHVHDVEMVVAQKEGQQRRLSASGRPLIDADGRKHGAVVSMHDITAQREVQIAREAAIRGQALQREAEAAERAVRESTERFALLLNSSAEGIYGMAPDSTCIFLNNAGARMLGYQADELVGRPIHDVIHHHRRDGSHYPQKECKIGIASRAGTFTRVDDEVFWHKDGSSVPVSYSVNPMIVAGRNTGSVITFTDATERRRAEEALRASNERTQLAADAGGLGLYTWELANDTVVWHNDIPFDIFGVPKGGIPLNAAQFASEFVVAEDAAAFAESMAATLDRAQPFHFEGRICRLSDREIRWVEFTGRVQTVNGLPIRVVGTAADITPRKQAEQALRQSEERLRQLANTIPNLVWIANADGWITWYNDRWYTYTGTTPSEMEGWGWQSVHDPNTLPQVMQRWTASIETGQPFEMTFPLRGADGIFRPFYTLVAPLRDAHGKVVQWFGTNTDVTPLKKAEAELRDADRRKDEFLAMLAHELRNPLAPIRNAAEILRRLNSPDPSINRASEMIARQVSHMAGLLNDLLDVSRVTRGAITLDKERVDLASAIANAVEQVRPLLELKQHRLSLDNCHLGTYVFGSPLRLTQIVANLLDNAAKYSPPQASISIEVLSSGREVSITVSDSGMGNSADLLPHVFEPFSQAERGTDRAQGGLGLGLAVVKGLVELHGGTVSVESEGVGKGSCFSVILPMYHEPARENTAALEGDRFDVVNDSLDVLLVDDNVDAVQSLADLLQAYGHRTMVARTGLEAVEAAQRMRFHAAVLDIGLPDITGYEVATRIRNAANPAPILAALTGYGQPEDRAAALNAGFSRHLVKPVDPQALLRFLDECAATWQATT